jgi:hypothetical protein
VTGRAVDLSGDGEGGKDWFTGREGGTDWAPEPEMSFMCRLGFKLSESLGNPVDERKL